MPRPIAFKPEEKLQDAMMLFWRKGYSATSLADLVGGLQINRFSIYNTFGDKQALFQQVLRRYRQQVFEASIAPLQRPGGGLDCLREYFNGLSERLSASGSGELGCLIQNTSLEGGVVDAWAREYVRETIAALHTRFAAVLRGALELGELPSGHNIEGCAGFLVAQVQGMIVARKVAGIEVMEAGMAFMLAEIDRWQADGERHQ